MELNRKAHPDCVHASNPYHECASACLERISNGKGRKDIKKQASKLTNVPGGYAKRKKEIESRPKPHQNGSLSTSNNPAKDPTMTPSHISKKNLASEKKESSSSFSSEEQSKSLYAQDASFNPRQDQFSGPMIVSANNTPDLLKDATLKPTNHEITDEQSNTEEDTRSFDFLSPSMLHDNDGSNGNNNNNADDDDEVESVISDSCVPVGKYHVKSTVSSILQSIIDKHGDIAANCKLESASMRARFLECLCSVVQELKSTPFDRLTKVKVKEMLAVLKDLESVNITVDWLGCVLEELLEAVEVKSRDKEKERYDGLVGSLRADLKIHEEDLAHKEKEAAEARVRVDKTRARLGELEMEGSRLNGIEDKVAKFRGQSYMDKVL